MIRPIAALALVFLVAACTSKKAEKAAAKPETKAAAQPAPEPAQSKLELRKTAAAQAQGLRLNVRDGAKLPQGFDLQFSVTGKEVSPAGSEADNPAKGHHHLIIDGAPIPAGTPVPADAKHIHYGKGQTGTKLDLPPGKYSLTLQFADGAHRSFGPEWSSTVNVEIVPKAAHRRVYFVGLKDGDTVTSPLTVTFGLDGMELSPAGQNAQDKTKGHHHLIIDGTGISGGSVIPSDAQHKHFGSGQTSTSVELTPGPHRLTLQFGDGLHQSYGEDLSATVNVIVK